MILWNNDAIGPVSTSENISVPANPQNDRVQTGIDFESLTILTPGLLLLSHSIRRFGGHRHRVLQRDRHRCRACGNGGRVIVHHRRPGSNRMDLLITLCLACHARVHRTLVLHWWTPPLRELWEEVRPNGPVQFLLFAAPPPDALQQAA